MSASCHEYRAEFRCGARAVLKLDPAAASITWDPEFPRWLKGERRRKFLQAYRHWRDESLADFGKQTGRRVVVVEI